MKKTTAIATAIIIILATSVSCRSSRHTAVSLTDSTASTRYASMTVTNDSLLTLTSIKLDSVVITVVRPDSTVMTVTSRQISGHRTASSRHQSTSSTEKNDTLALSRSSKNEQKPISDTSITWRILALLIAIAAAIATVSHSQK